MMANAQSYAYGNRGGCMVESDDSTIVSVSDALKKYYSEDAGRDDDGAVRGVLSYGNLFINSNIDAAVKAGVMKAGMREAASEQLLIPFGETHPTWASPSDMMVLDLLNASISQG